MVKRHKALGLKLAIGEEAAGPGLTEPGLRGVDVQATRRLTTRGRVRLGPLQNQVAIGLSDVSPRQ